MDGHFYLPSGSDIYHIPDLQYIKHCVDPIEADKICAMSTNPTPPRNPQPHMTTGILTVTYPDSEPEQDAVLDIQPSILMAQVQVFPSLGITDPEFQPYVYCKGLELLSSRQSSQNLLQC